MSALCEVGAEAEEGRKWEGMEGGVGEEIEPPLSLPPCRGDCHHMARTDGGQGSRG